MNLQEAIQITEEYMKLNVIEALNVILEEAKRHIGRKVEINYNCTLLKMAEQIDIELWQAMEMMKYFENRSAQTHIELLEMLRKKINNIEQLLMRSDINSTDIMSLKDGTPVPRGNSPKTSYYNLGVVEAIFNISAGLQEIIEGIKNCENANLTRKEKR